MAGIIGSKSPTLARGALAAATGSGLHTTRGDKNMQLLLRKRPVGVPDPSSWELVESAIPIPAAEEVLVQVEYASMDPAMRGWMRDAKSYVEPVGLGEVMRAFTVGKVIDSKCTNLKVGDVVVGLKGIQNYYVGSTQTVTKVDPSLAPLPTFVGGLGMPGMTAYFGLLEVGKPKEGDTVVVSAAAGAVGSVVCQIAKIKGCRVVGIAGGEQKCQYLREQLGVDAAIDYKTQNVHKALGEHCPKGIDVYFDNVGGDILDAALAWINRGARVALCGAISQYNNESFEGPKNYMSLMINRGSMQGFIVTDYRQDYPRAMADMARWYKEGKLTFKEHIVEGIENFPKAFNMLFTGGNFGKLVLKLR